MQSPDRVSSQRKSPERPLRRIGKRLAFTLTGGAGVGGLAAAINYAKDIPTKEADMIFAGGILLGFALFSLLPSIARFENQ